MHFQIFKILFLFLRVPLILRDMHTNFWVEISDPFLDGGNQSCVSHHFSKIVKQLAVTFLLGQLEQSFGAEPWIIGDLVVMNQCELGPFLIRDILHCL